MQRGVWDKAEAGNLDAIKTVLAIQARRSRLFGLDAPIGVAVGGITASEFGTRAAELIGELTMKSPQFAALWAKHPVANCVSGTKHFQHPEVGRLELEFEALLLADEPGARILMYSAAPGSPSEAALQLLHAQRGSVPTRAVTPADS